MSLKYKIKCSQLKCLLCPKRVENEGCLKNSFLFSNIFTFLAIFSPVLQYFHLFVLMIRLKYPGACLYLVQIILINLIDVDPAHTVIRLVDNFLENNSCNLIFTVHLKENSLFQIENSNFLLKSSN